MGVKSKLASDLKNCKPRATPGLRTPPEWYVKLRENVNPAQIVTIFKIGCLAMVV